VKDDLIVIIYAAIYLGCLFILRPFFNRLKYGMYLQYASITEIEKNKRNLYD